MSQPILLDNENWVLFGPFVDADDGKTAETALTITVYLSKNGAASAARNSSTAIAHDRSGWYRVHLNTTDCNTPGNMTLFAAPAGALPREMKLHLVNQDYWNFASPGGLVAADVWGWYGEDVEAAGALLANATALNNMADFFATLATLTNMLNFFSDTGYDAVNSTVGSGSGAVDVASIDGDEDAADRLRRFFTTGYTAAAGIIGAVNLVNSVVDAKIVDIDDAGASGLGEPMVAFRALFGSMIYGTVASGANTTTSIASGRSETTDDLFVNRSILIVGADGKRQGGRVIDGYDGTTKVISFTPALATTPQIGDTYLIVG